MGSVKVFYRPFSRDQLIARLSEGLPALAEKLDLRRVVLFGSWATNRATAFSDVDVLVVYGGPARDDAYRLVRAAFEIRGLEPHVYSEDEAEALHSTVTRMTRDGIDLLSRS
ncbi:MAG: nucleotidyltransferase domain-containing protein [Chloroflexi bacterium]|nr:nucleotidyltransferase domain-containing protein [Chloroflexota bacterium]